MTADTEYEIPAGEAGPEPGTYFATLTALKPFTLYETSKGWTREKPDDGLAEAYSKIEWHFHTEDGERLEGVTSTARSEKSTLFAWATGLGLAPAVVLDRSKPIPAGLLLGREAMVTVQLDKNGYPRVTTVVPAPKARAAAPVDQPMTRLPNQVEPEGEFVGAPRQAAAAPAVPEGDLPF
jgi:hypothetical protein